MLLEVRQLSKTFRVRETTVQALADVTFQITDGESLSVVGGSGSGKTTLAKILCRLFPADAGDVLWDGERQDRFTTKAWARHIQMVFQDPFASLNPKLTVYTQLKEVLQLNPTQDNIKDRAAALLESVGLKADVLTRYPFQFSGGQRQRIAIARAIALQPKVLIADEPLSALDQGTQEQMVSLFQSLKKNQGLTFLLITHDLRLAERLTDRVIVLESGRIVEEGAVRDVLTYPHHGYTRALVEAIP